MLFSHFKYNIYRTCVRPQRSFYITILINRSKKRITFLCESDIAWICGISGACCKQAAHAFPVSSRPDVITYMKKYLACIAKGISTGGNIDVITETVCEFLIFNRTPIKVVESHIYISPSDFDIVLRFDNFTDGIRQTAYFCR